MTTKLSPAEARLRERAVIKEMQAAYEAALAAGHPIKQGEQQEADRHQKNEVLLRRRKDWHTRRDKKKA